MVNITEIVMGSISIAYILLITYIVTFYAEHYLRVMNERKTRRALLLMSILLPLATIVVNAFSALLALILLFPLGMIYFITLCKVFFELPETLGLELYLKFGELFFYPMLSFLITFVALALVSGTLSIEGVIEKYQVLDSAFWIIFGSIVIAIAVRMIGILFKSVLSMRS
jgi:hypothetical protein